MSDEEEGHRLSDNSLGIIKEYKKETIEHPLSNKQASEPMSFGEKAKLRKMSMRNMELQARKGMVVAKEAAVKINQV